jgi:hypothetical protein
VEDGVDGMDAYWTFGVGSLVTVGVRGVGRRMVRRCAFSGRMWRVRIGGTEGE